MKYHAKGNRKQTIDTITVFLNLIFMLLPFIEFQLNIPYRTFTKTEAVNNNPYSLTNEHKEANRPKTTSFLVVIPLFFISSISKELEPKPKTINVVSEGINELPAKAVDIIIKAASQIFTVLPLWIVARDCIRKIIDMN